MRTARLRWSAGLFLALSIVGILAADSAAEKTATARLDATGVSGLIDRAIHERLLAGKIELSPPAGDAEFLRRVYLDILGVIPPADKAAAFLDSKDPAKRAKLIEELLASPLYGRHLADIWSTLLLPRTSDNRRVQFEPMRQWLEERFNKNQPWDQMVTDLVTASGEQDQNGAVTFFVANQTVDKFTDQVTRLFLGVQLQCAQCHNHPFTGWKQAEYWGMAAFFMKVRPDNAKQAKNKSSLAVSEVSGPRGGKNKLPESAKIVPAKFLGGAEPKLNSSEPYRPVLARWMTAPGNPFFARAMVNRVWGQFFGTSFVNPVDNMHDGNPPSHPELLQSLANQFVANQFDLKFLIRAICNSETYQRSSRPLAGNEEDDKLYSHMPIKVLTPEQLFDSLAAVSGPGDQNGDRVRPKQAAKGAPVGRRAQFVAFFQGAEEASITEYQAGIPQALRLMNSNEFRQGSALVNQVAKPNVTAASALTQIYLTTLSRRPTPEEMQRLTAYVQKKDTKAAYGDIVWAILNSSEFTLNH
jgi:hypothetical protein